jgi:hypothetical protein
MLHRVFVPITVIVALSLCVFADTHHEGTQSGTWTPAGNTHLIDDDCWIQPGNTLSIEAGCLVEFQGHYCIIDSGIFNAIGTEESPILFTAHADSPQVAGFWKALIAAGTQENPAIMSLTNCEIRYGGEHETDPLSASGVVRCVLPSHVEITDCYIHHNWGEGVGTDHNGANQNHLELTDCRIENCEIGVKLILPDENTEVISNWIESCNLGMRLDTDPNFPFNPIVANNIIKNSQGNGVEDLATTELTSYLAHFKNNVIDGSGLSGMYFTSNIEEEVVQNNIFMNNSHYGIEVIDGRTGNVSFNSFYGNTLGRYTGNVISDPEVTVNPELTAAFGDENYYHLQWDSPCLGAGTGVKLILPDENTKVKRNWIESCDLGMRLDTDPEVGGKVANNIIRTSSLCQYRKKRL